MQNSLPLHSFWQTLPKPFSALAPMEDVTDTSFRRLVAKFHRPDVYFSEFTSTDGLFSKGRERVAHRLVFEKSEGPIVAQIWGNKPENYRKAAQIIAELGFDGIDINMGCPVGKIVKKGECAGLIKNPSLAKELYLAAQEGAPTLPVSIKTRLGFDSWQTENWSAFLLRLRPAALTIHGRIAKELSVKPANWHEIAKVVTLKDTLSPETVIIGNGDVRSYRELRHRHEETKVDGVMIGRGVFCNLCIFDPVERDFNALPAAVRLSTLITHLDMFIQAWGNTRSKSPLKKFFKIYISGFSGARELREQLLNIDDETELRDAVYSLIEKLREQ